jgi:hypothetical protein
MPKGQAILDWMDQQEQLFTPAAKKGKKGRPGPGRRPSGITPRSRSMSPAINGTPSMSILDRRLDAGHLLLLNVLYRSFEEIGVFVVLALQGMGYCVLCNSVCRLSVNLFAT